jgi:uncharacterized protein YfaS (alpha-2-macroglobulin family)
MEGVPEAGNETGFSKNLSVNVAYYTTDGNGISVERLTQGTDFIAKVTISNLTNVYYRDLALTQIFPPGWEISNNRMWDNELAVNKENPTYQDIRDDTVYTYFDLPGNGTRMFTFRLNASYLGRYYLTGAYCEAMYDNSIAAMNKGRWIEVVEPGK